MTFGSANVGVSQSGKSGGDASGSASASGYSCGGSGRGAGSASSASWGSAGGAGVGIGGDAGTFASAGQMGGDVSDNTSIGDININS